MVRTPSGPRSWTFLAAYASSGAAGLVYEVCWSRWLALYMGHGVAAASTVVAAFLGGLAAGSALGGSIAARSCLRRSLYAYAAIEGLVALLALAVRTELASLFPLLRSSYHDATSPFLFSTVRLLTCLAIVFVPATGIGATFPLALRYFARDGDPRRAGWLYAANTAGAAAGCLIAGFGLVPAVGILHTLLVGAALSGLAALVAMALARTIAPEPAVPSSSRPPRRRTPPAPAHRISAPTWVALMTLGVTGFVGSGYEIAWMRTFSMIVGPTIYAFSATVTVIIAGSALGAVIGSLAAGSDRSSWKWLALCLSLTAMANATASRLAGGWLPETLARALASAPAGFNHSVGLHTLLGAGTILPMAIGLGACLPLSLSLMAASGSRGVKPFSLGYAMNAMGAVAGTLGAGLIAIPGAGLELTLRGLGLALVAVGAVVIGFVRAPARARFEAAAVVAIAAVFLSSSSGWNRELLASGVYKYAPYAVEAVDLESALTAGSLLYYREGAAATVSVKELTGTRSLAIDGKVDASNGGDMLTQKMLAHLPLLLHPAPHDVCIIGLGSGVTLASALTHRIARADVVEISPEIAVASRYFAAENRNALADPRTRLIVGDARSHLVLTPRKYDVIVSEPSNAWMAGVATLFTREFFAALRERLLPGGVICQWAHTYDIADADLRAIVATFADVFPDATIWLAGGSDLLLIGSNGGDLDARLARVPDAWERPGVAEDLRSVAAVEPFDVFSMFAAGPREIQAYAASAAIQTDDRPTLEFSGPRAVGAAPEAATSIRALLADQSDRPAAIASALRSAGASQWRDRGTMLLAASDYLGASEAYLEALDAGPPESASVEGLVRAAVAARDQAHALDVLQASARRHPRSVPILLGISRLLAAGGSTEPALEAANAACAIDPSDPSALEQAASVLADSGDVGHLELVVDRLRRVRPEAAPTLYYGATALFMRQRLADARRLAQEAARRDAGYAAPHNLIGAIEAMVGNGPAARASFLEARRLNAHDVAAYINLGLLDLDAGDRAAAAGEFAEALSLDPRSEAARRGFARARGGS